MPTEHQNKLAALIKNRREELLADWRSQVQLLPGAADLDTPTINDEVPQAQRHAISHGDTYVS